MFFDDITKEEKSLILEALLFASGGDVDADWDIDTAKSMLELAEKLKDNIGKDYNISRLHIFPPNEKNVNTADWPLVDKLYLEITRHIIKSFDKINIEDFGKATTGEQA